MRKLLLRFRLLLRSHCQLCGAQLGPGACRSHLMSCHSLIARYDQPNISAGDAQDPGCVVPPDTLTDLLAEWRADPVCGVGNSTADAAVACTADYLARAAESPEAETATSLLKLECDGMVQRDTGACGAGRMPLISVTAQHQIHIFIFSVRSTCYGCMCGKQSGCRPLFSRPLAGAFVTDPLQHLMCPVSLVPHCPATTTKLPPPPGRWP